MKRIMTAALVLLICVSTQADPVDNNMPLPATGIKETYVMLYYRDMAAPRHFYADILGLESTFEDDWVSLYRLAGGSHVGVVKEGPNSYHKVQEKNAVMLSLVVDDVDGWYRKIQAHPDVPVLKEVSNSQNVPIRAFLVQDPGGYVVEVFQWLKQEDKQ